MNYELLQSANRPFRAIPDARFYYAHESIETARQTVVRAVLRAEGPVIVLGGAGLGKSLLGEVIACDLQQRLDIVRLHAARLCSRRALLQNILFELQMPYRDMSEGELRLSILDRLEPSPETAPDGVLLLVDEAHTLPMKLLDELRLINNFNRNNQPRTRLVLIGNMRLEDTFTAPQMDSFNQRLAARCYLQPMNRQDTYEYVRHQLSVAGIEPNDTITREGLDAVYAASEGVPRLVNQVMDHALVLAIANSQNPISAPLVEEAWADLQQLPAPWHSTGDATASDYSAEVEFGSLEELDVRETESQAERSNDASSDLPAAFEPRPLSPSNVDEDDASEFGVPELGVTQLGISELAVPELDVPALAASDAEDKPKKENYFAAFSPSDEYDLPNESSGDTSRTLDSQVDAVSGQDEETPETLVDSADTAEQDAACNDMVAAGETYSTLSYFADKPTDEQFIAFEDEQAQYDAMGVWENDPPLAALDTTTIQPSTDPIVSPDAQLPKEEDSKVGQKPASPPPTSSNVTAKANADSAGINDLFGSDFDEEVEVPSSRVPGDHAIEAEVNSRLHRSGAPLQGLESLEFQSDTLAQQAAADAADYVARIQEFADSIASANGDSPTVEAIVASIPEGKTSADAEAWQVDAEAVDMESEIAIAQDIEDIVSQLNFSAFTVEPFSVEQIAVEAPQKRQAPKDSIRSGENEEIYMLHRAQQAESQSFFNDLSAEYDDDRDLLIIEEDLPVSSKVTDQIQEEVRPKKAAQYSQLFAKLRK